MVKLERLLLVWNLDAEHCRCICCCGGQELVGFRLGGGEMGGLIPLNSCHILSEFLPQLVGGGDPLQTQPVIPEYGLAQ